MKKQKTIRTVFREYMHEKIKLEKWQWLGLMMLIVVFAGTFGWLYEFIFYYFDAGTGEFYMQGGNFLPWINIYAIGAVLIVASCWRLRKHPWAIFLLSMVLAGIVEFIGGWLVYVIGDGTRYWDYNVEILNFGNIGGFVCLRSVLVFGVSSVFMMYAVIPFFLWLMQKISKRAFLTLAISLFVVVMTDEIYNILAAKCFGWPSAIEYWQAMGWKYLS